MIVLDSLPPSHTVAIHDSRRSVPAHSYTEITRRGCVASLYACQPMPVPHGNLPTPASVSGPWQAPSLRGNIASLHLGAMQ